LDLPVTVEGVETEEQLALVARERSITEVQGFYIGSAMPAEEIRQAPVLTAPRKWSGSPESTLGASGGVVAPTSRATSDQPLPAALHQGGLMLNSTTTG